LPRESPGIVVTAGGTIFALGGRLDEEFKSGGVQVPVKGTVEIFDPDQNSWKFMDGIHLRNANEEYSAVIFN
jgi:hypothetical protein